MSARRYAILDDNQRELETRLATLRQILPELIATRACATMVIGSVADGRAGDESDIDVVVVLREGVPSMSPFGYRVGM